METRSALEIRALRYLAQREHSRRELAQKLCADRHAHETEALTALLDKLQQQGHLSEERTAEHVARSRRTRFGSRRIAHELKSKGIADHLIGGILQELKMTELETAMNVWRKKFDQPPTTGEARIKQTRFMAHRGFSLTVIEQVFAQAIEENR
ncbi:MAG: recombination regulator RecX [Nitrosomonas sp.]|nr:MAG: recombination regulator RecX [Nitrosomonas sp.]